MSLKVNKIEYFEVEYNDFEKLVEEVYNLSDNEWNYSFIADIGCGNDSTHSFSTIHDSEWDEADKNELRQFTEKGVYYNIAKLLLSDLARKGIIEEGNYLINVCW